MREAMDKKFNEQVIIDQEMMDDINGLEFTQTMSNEEVEDTFLQELFEEEPYIMIVNSDP